MGWFVMSHPSESGSRVIICRGARATERRLLHELDVSISGSVEELARPVRIVVPSKSLRRHLLRTIAQRNGAAVGIEVTTLFGLALQIAASCGQQAPRADDGFQVLVRRLAGASPVLHSGLDGLSDGYDAVVGAVRDLLDAGFLPGNEDGVLERLDDLASEVASERVERARSLVLLASASFDAADAMGLPRSLRALQLAEEALSLHGEQVLPTRALLVHGFADVTGVAADLLVTLVRTVGGTVLLDRPPDPSDSGRADAGGSYLGRIEERLRHLEIEEDAIVDEPPCVELAEAPDGESEARWVAERVRTLLDEGATAEHIGIVGRTLEGMASALRRHLRRLGIPFSGEGATVPGAGETRRLQRLVEVLERGPSSEIDLWLEARAEHARTCELLLGLRVLGVSRVTDLARLPMSESQRGVVLPLAVGPDDEVDDVESSRRLSPGVLRAATAEAEAFVKLVEQWPARAPAQEHRKRTVELVTTLAWPDSSMPARTVLTVVDALCREFPDDFELTVDEWRKLLGDRLKACGQQEIGGRGRGVQVLTVMEARARTFDHLFVVGANRGIFPRLANEDPMLAEAVRVRLAADVLPEMPVKGRSADEERYLFAQLMSSAPQVTVSWKAFGSEGTMAPSPFVDRLRSSEVIGDPLSVSPLWTSEEPVRRARTSYELAVDVAGRDGLAELKAPLEAALAEGRGDAGVDWMEVSPESAASARIDLIRAVEHPQSAAAVSPWFGLTNADHGDGREPLWVTHAERIGTCPWRAFVERRLGVLPLPDPLLGLPGIDGPLVGRVVHEVLESVAAETVEAGGTLDAAVARSPSSISWPDAAALEEMVTTAAQRVAAKAGLAPVGMAPLLAARSRELLAVARRLDWEGGSLAGVVGLEVEGEADVDGWPGRLAFRADRLDVRGGTLELVDYKTGKPLSEAKGEDTRRRHLRAKVSRGRVLQAAAYACAAGAEAARGRYLYLKPDDEWTDEVRVLEVESGDDEVQRALATAIDAISAARSLGVVFPRVEEADGRPAEHCRSCPVAEACRRDDSGFRRGLVAWMSAADGARDDDAATASRKLWWLGFERPEEVE